jgi:hypothetical protein
MTVYLVISLPKIPYVHRTYMVMGNPARMTCAVYKLLRNSPPNHACQQVQTIMSTQDFTQGVIKCV